MMCDKTSKREKIFFFIFHCTRINTYCRSTTTTSYALFREPAPYKVWSGACCSRNFNFFLIFSDTTRRAPRAAAGRMRGGQMADGRTPRRGGERKKEKAIKILLLIVRSRQSRRRKDTSTLPLQYVLLDYVLLAVVYGTLVLLPVVL